MDNNKQIYAFELDDYAAPSCTSFTKMYFGTIADFRAVIGNIGEEEMEELQNAFEHFAAGERKIMYYAGQARVQFARPVKLIKEKEFAFERVKYEYENSYGFTYHVHMTRAEGKVALVKLGKEYFVVYRMTATNPRYKADIPKDSKSIPLGDTIWGHPGILKVKGKTIENLLAMVESKCEDEQSALARFNDLSNFNFNYFFEDIFGDG